MQVEIESKRKPEFVFKQVTICTEFVGNWIISCYIQDCPHQPTFNRSVPITLPYRNYRTRDQGMAIRSLSQSLSVSHTKYCVQICQPIFSVTATSRDHSRLVLDSGCKHHRVVRLDMVGGGGCKYVCKVCLSMSEH